MELNIELLKKDTETAEMLCKIVNGFWDRTVELIHNPGDRAIVCRVGDLWFHFLSEEEEQLDAEDIRERYDIFTLSNMILDALLPLRMITHSCTATTFFSLVKTRNETGIFM